MADTKISSLSAVTDVLATDEFVLARAGTTKKIDAIDLAGGLAAPPGVGPTVIDDIALGSDATTIDFTSIPGGYTSLWCEFIVRAADSGARSLWVRFNNDSGSNYSGSQLSHGGGTPTSATFAAQSAWQVAAIDNGGNASGSFGSGELKIPFYDGTARLKAATAVSSAVDTGTSGYNFVTLSTGVWNSTAAITRVTLVCSSGNFLTGSRAVLYGAG